MLKKFSFPFEKEVLRGLLRLTHSNIPLVTGNWVGKTLFRSSKNTLLLDAVGFSKTEERTRSVKLKRNNSSNCYHEISIDSFWLLLYDLNSEKVGV